MFDPKGKSMSTSAYEVLHPERNLSCVLFASPHSGRDYAWSFLRGSVLDEHVIRSSEDAFVDQLFEVLRYCHCSYKAEQSWLSWNI